MFKSLTFDNVNSLDYGVHINGEGVYNAPERDVEMIAIPGRNGEYALDHGRFNNIEVTYPAGIGEMSQADFADKISAFRNALASRRGYYRLEDGYHPDEYRMGVYKSGLEASPVMYNRAGEFDLIFNCKPQRFLKSGEQRTELTESGVINNPTPFDSQPLLELTGYGTLEVNGSTIELHNDSPGVITLAESKSSSSSSSSASFPQPFVTEEYYSGDAISHGGFTISLSFRVYGGQAENLSVSASAGDFSFSRLNFQADNSGRTLYLNAAAENFTFSAGTLSSLSKTITASFYVNSVQYSFQYRVKFDYEPADKQFLLKLTSNIPSATLTAINILSNSVVMLAATVDSTYLPLGFPLYLDCEIGEAYKIENGEIILINNNIEIPSDLPVFSPGENQIVMDSTYTKVGIIPRWWII